MKLTTIWTLKGLPLRERLHRTADWWWLWLAGRLPARLAYWSFIREARFENDVVPDTLYMTLLERHRGGRP